jgi:hypothetical protein
MAGGNMNLKVLKLESWMRFDLSFYPEEYSNLDRIEPIVNRHGYYCYNGYVWFECGKGTFHIKDGFESFNLSLSMLQHKHLREEEEQAILLLRRAKLLPKSLLEVLKMEHFLKDIRANRTDMGKRFIHFKRSNGI